jgi:hypothetical protein
LFLIWISGWPTDVVSELLLLHAVEEEEEDGVGLAVLGVGEGEGGVSGFLRLADEDLHLIELAHDELDGLGGALLERLDAVGLVVLLQVAAGLLHEGLDHLHAVLLGEGDFLELVSVNNVDNGLTLLIVGLVISCA